MNRYPLALACGWLFSACTGGGDDTSAPQETDPQDSDALLSPPTERTDIYWGDTHVHTRFSFDAYVTMSQSELDEDPLVGELLYARDVREACDFAHYCSQIDFMVSTEHAENVPESLWGQVKNQLRECDTAYGPTTLSPDGLQPLHAFAGWEWTQGNPAATGAINPNAATSRTQYGHKNVIYPELDEASLPLRVVASSAITPPREQLCAVARLCGPPEHAVPTFECPAEANTAAAILAFQHLNQACSEGTPEDHRFDRGGECFGVCAFFADTSGCTTCNFGDGCDLDGVDATAMTPDTCPQYAFTAGDLFGILRSWEDRFGYPRPIVGSHGTTWYNGGHGNWAVDYPTDLPDPGNFRQHDPELQTFIEVMSKHGSGESHPSTVAATPEAQPCYDGTGAECFQPTSSAPGEDAVRYVKEGSVQFALSQQQSTPDGDFALNLGILASMDTHHARPGSATEVPAYGEWESAEVFCGLAGIEDCPFQFAYAGGLAAVHAPPDAAGQVRTALFDGLRNRHVYGTSGPRIELWFYMTNPPAGAACIEDGSGECPMGSVLPAVPVEAGGTPFVPRFRIHAKGAPQTSTECDGQPFPTGFDGGAAAFHDDICRDQCFHVTSERDEDRNPIAYLEVIRVLRGWYGTDGVSPHSAFQVDPTLDDDAFGLGAPGEPIHTVDTIRLPCAGASGEGATDCWADFTDPQWATLVANGANAVYYVRALQQPSTAYNGATGTAQEVPCTEPGAQLDEAGACFSTTRERAWSSPIFLFSGSVATELP